MAAFSPRPVRIAWRTQASLITGSMPGIAASMRETCSFGSAPNPVEAPENSFASLVTWAWISMPTITSQSPVAPLMSFDAFAGGWRGAFMNRAFAIGRNARRAVPRGE
jgi:hypothetical protein